MNIVFYGGGNIAQAFIEGLINSGYKKNNITPVIESDFSSLEKHASVSSFFENNR